MGIFDFLFAEDEVIESRPKKKRGLAAASKATRTRVARKGGRSSHGGGRPKKSSVR